MNNEQEKPDFFDKPDNIKKILRVFYAICILLVVADFIVHRHIYHSWENIPAFYAIYGFVGCVLLVLLAKVMRKLLMREEDYYDK
ncbi:hypothetical protein [Thalassotalea agarivorans]|uniref:Uncharacterized protein n=1 Tax=Thalassotalea agarivorans TaxID=349064 RepID=A0A1I0F089_THASX|nr:hypothetical protein [Thalassotalea agarivorans]SET51046.1 hypothetical protein SAMN05660429_02005 [Thalassotalea agarivorans]